MAFFHFISIQTAFSVHFSFLKHFFYISLAYVSLKPFPYNHLETIFSQKFFLNGKFTPFIFHSHEQMGRKCYFDHPLCSGLPFSSHFFSEPFLIEKMVSCIYCTLKLLAFSYRSFLYTAMILYTLQNK